MKVFIATWDHKHGTDLSVHREYEGAKGALRQWAKDSLEELSWDNYEDPSFVKWSTDLDGAINNWPEISGGEYMEVRGPFEVGK